MSKPTNLRSRLPHVFHHFRCISGTHKYVLSYPDNVMEEIDWEIYGF